MDNKIKYLFVLGVLLPSVSHAADGDFTLPVSMLTDMYNGITEFISRNLSSYVGKVNSRFLPLMGACVGVSFVW